MTINNYGKKIHLILLIVCFLSLCVMTACRKSTPSQPNEPDVAKEEAKSSSNISIGLQQIIDKSGSFNVILQDYYGKEMPDFKVTDINGKTLSLKDYRGKNVMVVMWATWCQPCLQEVPHLNTLREMNPEEKLAILAISNERLENVKQTAQQQKMQYTVIATSEQLPLPFSEVKNIPTTFFIRPDGTLKLATEGGTIYGQMKAILLAE